MGAITTPDGFSVAASAKEAGKNTLSYTVSPNSTKTFDVTFAPALEQAYSGNVVITSSDTGHPSTNIAVSGTGTVPVFGLPFTQNFNASTSLPTSWTIVDNQGNGQVWQFGTHTSGLGGTPGNYAYVNSDGFGSGNSQNCDLVTPKINMSAGTNVTVSFTYYFRSYTGSSATLSYSTNGGSSWTQVQQWTATSANPATFSQVITALDGQANVKLKWNYTGTWGYYFDVDDISITATITAPSAPSNLTTTVSGSDMTVSWTASAGATSYDVYSSDDPYGTYSFETNVTTNSYTTAYTAAKKFWYVVAKN
jgi:hypothetical protein